jgi:hypothetical protein
MRWPGAEQILSLAESRYPLKVGGWHRRAHGKLLFRPDKATTRQSGLQRLHAHARLERSVLQRPEHGADLGELDDTKKLEYHPQNSFAGCPAMKSSKRDAFWRTFTMRKFVDKCAKRLFLHKTPRSTG